MAINVSPVQLRSPSFASNLRAILKETGVEPRYLELELTETFLLDDSNSTAAVLDDFGTGYSSLTYLKRFPIDALKIDRSFVKDLITDADDASIVTAVIGMGKSLNMLIVAEGVETQEQLEFLQKHHCPQGQGFYFSRPAAAADIGDLLKQGLAGSEFAPSARTRARIGVR
jgi:EAL domain-containing protein (putative c-di-GMP-specific phosphodiesterase class I)